MTDRRSEDLMADLETLLVQRSTEALDRTEEQRLDDLSEEFPEVDTTAFDRAAAAIWLAATRKESAMPDELKQRILANAPGGQQEMTEE